MLHITSVNCWVFFAYFSVSQKRNIRQNPNRAKPSRGSFLEQTQYMRLRVEVKKQRRKARGRGARLPPWARPPPSWAPRSSTDLLLPPIYTYVPRNHPGAPRKPISTAATLCTREIPSWGLFLALRQRGHRSRRASTSTP